MIQVEKGCKFCESQDCRSFFAPCFSRGFSGFLGFAFWLGYFFGFVVWVLPLFLVTIHNYLLLLVAILDYDIKGIFWPFTVESYLGVD